MREIATVWIAAGLFGFLVAIVGIACMLIADSTNKR
jgi:hypothetical protein